LLPPGGTRVISVSNLTLGIGSSQGIIQVRVVSDQQAGSPAYVSYTVLSCFGP
jgi:hypothetical protein